MDIFGSIIEWAKTLKPWEQEGVRRLVMNGSVTPQDEDEIIALCKSVTAEEVEPPWVPHPQPTGITAVSLVSLEHVCGVNALAAGQALTFSHPTGLTVIYGDNGSGKSGYSRILKRVCRSREVNPPAILPDVYLCNVAAPTPRAKVVYQENGAEGSADWTAGVTCSEALAAIAVFDASCCRLYVEKDGELAYRPYGLEVFDQLGDLCKRIKQRLATEADSIQVTNLADQFTHSQVRGVVSAALSANSEENLAALRGLGALRDEDIHRATVLRNQIVQLETNDPEKMAASRRNLATRLEETTRKIGEAQSKTSAWLGQLPDVASKAAEATELAKKASALAFGEEPVAGVGSDQWKAMFEYARVYSTEVAYPDDPFPNVGPNSRCLLCQQPLGEQAKDRLTRFAAFVGDKAEETARAANARYGELRNSVIDLANGIGAIDDALAEQVTEKSDAAAAALREARAAFATLAKSAGAASTPKEWEALTSPSIGQQELSTLMARLREEAADFEKNANPAELTKLTQELTLLSDRISLSKVTSVIIEGASMAAEKRRLRSLADSIDTTPITRQAGVIADRVLTKALCQALNEELDALDASHLEVEFVKKGDVGSIRHFLRLCRAPKGTKVEDVLSEGEHRCLGIAAFLTELRQAGHASAIVLDDPVSSLDHKHRDALADRLVAEAEHRQVIIFTHDMAFLYTLHRAAGRAQVPLARHAVARTPDGTGVPVKGLYPEEMRLVDLIKHIREQAAIIAARDADDPARRGRVVACYGLIRNAWERVVEETLLRSVVSPFDKAVHTKLLKGVQVDDKDYSAVFWAIEKASDIVDAHRSPAGGGTTRVPSDAELDKDVDALEAFRRAAEQRARELEKARKRLEGPILK